jgi:hypothetical protein
VCITDCTCLYRAMDWDRPTICDYRSLMKGSRHCLKRSLKKGNRRVGARHISGHIFPTIGLWCAPTQWLNTVGCSRLQTTADMVDCSRPQAVLAAVPKSLPVLVFPEDWLVTCDPVQSRVGTGPNGPYGTLESCRCGQQRSKAKQYYPQTASFES